MKSGRGVPEPPSGHWADILVERWMQLVRFSGLSVAMAVASLPLITAPLAIVCGIALMDQWEQRMPPHRVWSAIASRVVACWREALAGGVIGVGLVLATTLDLTLLLRTHTNIAAVGAGGLFVLDAVVFLLIFKAASLWGMGRASGLAALVQITKLQSGSPVYSAALLAGLSVVVAAWIWMPLIALLAGGATLAWLGRWSTRWPRA